MGETVQKQIQGWTQEFNIQEWGQRTAHALQLDWDKGLAIWEQIKLDIYLDP